METGITELLIMASAVIVFSIVSRYWSKRVPNLLMLALQVAGALVIVIWLLIDRQGPWALALAVLFGVSIRDNIRKWYGNRGVHRESGNAVDLS